MSSSNRYREIEVSGSPQEIGRQIGEAACEEIRGFADIALERVNKGIVVSRENALSAARGSLSYVESYAPHLAEELRGMSAASGVSLDDLMLLQVRNQLRPDDDAGCTSFSMSAPAWDGSVVAQNWDNDSVLNPFTVVLTRRPSGKPALMNVTQAGLIGYIGLNSAGIGMCLNTLPAPSRKLGVPHYFTVRAIYETGSLEEAVEAVRRAHRAIPANVILATPQGPADLEVTVDDVHVLRDTDRGIVTHTNHCEHPDLVAVNADFAELIQSGPRKRRIEKLLSDATAPLALDDLKAALQDHEGHPTSICRHPNDHPTTGFWTSTFSVIIEADRGIMHLTRGNPCENPYETYALN
ncbi:MAG: C45 family autoproteolytic acyltransferase/hydrolase [Candidatus Latescibacteria bacterium]|jgi:isopenicillin-N N-acyltransferase-like protein|nr:C45 family autoproteolytic acyltransferase/hydrolase [Candidatus Latescibacterota bacterium]